jgi:hypothetical protein
VPHQSPRNRQLVARPGPKHEVFEWLATREAVEMLATTLQRRSSVALEQCGVISTLGSSWNGRSDGLRSGSA